MFDRIILWSLKNRLIVILGTGIFIAAAIFVLKGMPVDVFPEFAPPQVVIQTEAPGLAPEDVEALITFPIESSVNGTPGVEKVRSASSVGLSTVIAVFKWGTDIYTARQLVNERIQAVRDRFPAGTNSPVMLPITSAVGWMIKYSLQSDTVSPMELRTISDWEIRPRILALGGVASVVSTGGDVKQYQVLLDPERLASYNVGVQEVHEALEKSNLNVPGGFLQAPGQEFIVTGLGRILTLEDVENTVIKFDEGTPIFVKNVAEVKFGGEVKRGDGAFGLKNAVIGTISKAYGADTLTTTYKAEKALEEMQKKLPKDVQMDIHVFRQADFIEASMRNLREALIEGGIIVSIVLILFLMNWRAAFISCLAMPVSLLGGVLILDRFGIGLNAMTLGGFAIAIGEVVDDAIIGVENVFRHLRLNRLLPEPAPAIDVVFRATSEIRNSVVYATLIVLLVFAPIFFLTGLEGRIFTPLGIAYIGSVWFSLLVALTTVPALCYILLAKSKTHGEEKESLLVRFLKRIYHRLLRFSLNHFYVITGFALILIAIAAGLIPFFGRSFLPEFHEGNFIIAMGTLPGTSLDESMRLGYEVRKKLLQHKQVVSISQRAGRSELDEDAQPPNFSEFDVKLDFERDKSQTPDRLLHDIREELSEIPGTAFNVGQFIAHRFDEILSGVRAQVAIKIYGPDLDVLRKKGQEVLNAMQTVKGVEDLQLEQQINVPQLIIKIDREKASVYGLKVQDLAESLETLLNGSVVSQVIEGQKSFDLFVRLDDNSRKDLTAIQNILIDAPTGTEASGSNKIPLSQIADVHFEERPYFINREDVQRRIVVQCNVSGNDLQSFIREAQAKIGNQVKLPSGYFVIYGGQFESQQNATKVLSTLGIIAIIGIFVLLFQAFKTVREALLVMFNLPLALIGGVIAVFIAGRDMSVASIIGFITLFGIAARNGIILVSHYNQLAQEGKSREEVVEEGSMNRLTPVLMTAATAALGLLPILWGAPTGKELERPLAIVVLGGLFTSTFLNMVVVPTVYNRIEIWREKRSTHSAQQRIEEKGVVRT